MERLHELPEFWEGAGKSSEFGGSSISILLDQEKCYEMVPFSCLWQEALSSDFSPTLRWMVLQSYGQPRVIKGLGSYSPGAEEAGHFGWMPFGHHFVEGSVLQDASAACSAAFISVLWGPGRRLVIHWHTSNPLGRGLRKVVDALDDTLKSPTQLGSFPSSGKSGAVCSYVSVEQRLRPFFLGEAAHLRFVS